MTDTNDGMTPETLRDLLVDAVARDAEESVLDELFARVPELGEKVFSLTWGPEDSELGASTDVVYRLAGVYVVSSADFGWSEPYATLDEAYAPIWVPGGTPEIWSSEWSDDDIIIRLELMRAGPAAVINGTRWPLETLEHRREQLWRHGPDGPDDGADDYGPELFMWPVARFEDGAMFRAEPPEDPDEIPAAALREAAAAARKGELWLERECRDAPQAELRFREALSGYEARLAEPHPRLAYLLDRIGLACHLQDRLAEAELLYRRSLEVLEVLEGPTRWTDLTVLNLAVLLGSQGRIAERDEVMKLYEP